MSNRERWIVYPLLVWALGMGFRSQYEWLFERSSLECQEVRILDEQGKLRLRFSADNLDGGRIALVDAEGSAAIVLQEKKGLVTLKPEKDQEIPPKAPN